MKQITITKCWECPYACRRTGFKECDIECKKLTSIKGFPFPVQPNELPMDCPLAESVTRAEARMILRDIVRKLQKKENINFTIELDKLGFKEGK